MKKIAIIATVIATALVLASCASKGTYDNGPVASNGSAQTNAAPGRHHHDYKGEMSK